LFLNKGGGAIPSGFVDSDCSELVFVLKLVYEYADIKKSLFD
jgi:hypothetical protein